MTKVCIVGHFGFGLKMLNGQTIKTKIIAEELERQLGQKEVMKIDTHGGLLTLPKIFYELFIAFKQCSNIVILPAHNGVRVFAPICRFFNIIFKRKLHYIVIGGWLPEFLSKKKKLANCLKKFNGIYVEAKTMKENLLKMGFKNLYILPNCKRLNALLEDELVFPKGIPYRLCTFSKVMEEKGIETVVDAVNKVNEILGYTAYSLDIYGQIQSGSEVWFEKLKRKFSKHINYCGVVEASKSVDVLKNYFALLFPTYFFTEDIPGTIIDAYAAGIPVISARWESFSNLIDDGKTGIGYEFNDNKGLEDLLIKVAHSPKQILDMKSNCIRKAKDYLPSEAMKIIFNEIHAGSSEYKLYPLSLCTFSRVMQEKGIEDAINAVMAINNKVGFCMFTLDIYGQVWEPYADRFNMLKRQFPEYIHYQGMVDSDKSVDVLKNYYALLFPTYYEGEGVAGTIIDAYSAGVPIIASDWRYNSELINDNTGYIYPTGNQDALIKMLEKTGEDPTLMLCRKKACAKEAKKYELVGVVNDLINKF